MAQLGERSTEDKLQSSKLESKGHPFDPGKRHPFLFAFLSSAIISFAGVVDMYKVFVLMLLVLSRVVMCKTGLCAKITCATMQLEIYGAEPDQDKSTGCHYVQYTHIHLCKTVRIHEREHICGQSTLILVSGLVVHVKLLRG